VSDLPEPISKMNIRSVWVHIVDFSSVDPPADREVKWPNEWRLPVEGDYLNLNDCYGRVNRVMFEFDIDDEPNYRAVMIDLMTVTS
jgi:hypothetical protein